MAEEKPIVPSPEGGIVTQTYSRLEQWVLDNKIKVSIIGGAFVLLFGGWLYITKFYMHAREEKAQGQMYMAVKNFEKDSFKLALNGDANFPGFEKVIMNYHWTKAANLAHYYAGVCELKLGKFQDAINYLKDYSLDDPLISCMAIGDMGDCYAELGKMNEAIDQYKKAAYHHDNQLTSPMWLKKAGLALEYQKRYEEALKIYREISQKYPESSTARDIEKYIARIEARS